MERLFTREEAEALLPALTPILLALREAARALAAARTEEEALATRTRGNGHRVDHERTASLRERGQELTRQISALVGQAQELGCEVKDLEMGLIDFRAERDGRVVYLCWRLGEPSIDYWHELDTGFAGREPL